MYIIYIYIHCVYLDCWRKTNIFFPHIHRLIAGPWSRSRRPPSTWGPPGRRFDGGDRWIDRIGGKYGCWTKNRGKTTPNHPFVHRVFHYFHHPFWGFSLFSDLANIDIPIKSSSLFWYFAEFFPVKSKNGLKVTNIFCMQIPNTTLAVASYLAGYSPEN